MKATHGTRGRLLSRKLHVSSPCLHLDMVEISNELVLFDTDPSPGSFPTCHIAFGLPPRILWCFGLGAPQLRTNLEEIDTLEHKSKYDAARLSRGAQVVGDS